VVVAVEVADDDVGGEAARRIEHLRREGPVAVAEQDRDGAEDVEIDRDREVEVAVVVEVALGERVGLEGLQP
jgi:hypothetical protein